ncbi:MAG: hypothetical protein MJ114_03425 [Acetatifactor sp.]|nr:hypothetical protein [Acetatifactor sp.]
MNKDTLIHRLQLKKYQISDELEKCKIQLGFMEGHLKDVTFNIKLYWSMLILPLILAGALLILASFMRVQNTIVYIASIVIALLITFIWLFYSGFIVYHLMKSYLFKRLQAKSEDSMIAEPPVRNPIEILNRPSKQTLFAGYKMTEWKIFRYMHFLDQIDQYLEVLKGEVKEETIQDITDKLETWTLYVDIEVEYDLPKAQKRLLNGFFVFFLAVAFVAGFAAFYNILLMLRR